MKPIGVCLTQMGKTGLELVNVYPNALPDSLLNELVIKSMPMSAKDGDFTSSTVQDCQFESYIFSIPGKDRKNIASLVAIFENSTYDRNSVRKFFSFTVAEIKKNNLGNTETFSKILPSMYEGLVKGKIKIKISSVVTLEFDFQDKDKKQKKRGEKFVDSLKDELWK